MDDFRRPQQPQRRDYTGPTPQRHPHGQPYQPPAQPPHHHSQPEHKPEQPVHHQPHHQTQPAHHQSHPSHHQPAYRQPDQQYQHQPQSEPEPYRSPSQIAAAQSVHTHKPPKTKKSPVLKIITGIVVLITSASLIYFGYSLRSSTSGNGISQKIIQQAPFTVYFPSPMPSGYTYMKDSATFQIGQVFFKFGNGVKRVTVNEQPLPSPAPKLDLPGYTTFKSTVGQASVGASFGVSAGEVIAGKTLITLNTSGGVTQDELKAAINNLKVIGLSTDKKQ